MYKKFPVLYDEDGDIFIYSTDQSAHQTLHECSLLLGTDKVKVQNALVGGGFGGKEDMTVQHLAALLGLAVYFSTVLKLEEGLPLTYLYVGATLPVALLLLRHLRAVLPDT